MGLRTESGSSRQAARPAPCAHAQLQAAPLSCGHLEPAQGCRLRGTALGATNQREHSEGWELGALRGLREFSRVRGAGEHHGFRPPHFQTAREGSTQVLGPACKVAAVCSLTHHPSPCPHRQREQAGSTGRYDTHLASLPAAAPAHWASGPHPPWLRSARQNHLHTQPTQRPHLRKAASPRLGEIAVLCNAYKRT